jgi:hypothetical protein
MTCEHYKENVQKDTTEHLRTVLREKEEKIAKLFLRLESLRKTMLSLSDETFRVNYDIPRQVEERRIILGELKRRLDIDEKTGVVI